MKVRIDVLPQEEFDNIIILIRGMWADDDVNRNRMV